MMKTACSEFEENRANMQRGRLSQEQWRAHLGTCRECRAQLMAHENLQRTLAPLAMPELPQNFSGLVHARIAEAQAANAMPRRSKAWLFLYWIAALAASVYVLRGATLPAWNLQFHHLAIMLAFVPLSFFALIYSERIFARVLRWFAPLLK